MAASLGVVDNEQDPSYEPPKKVKKHKKKQKKKKKEQTKSVPPLTLKLGNNGATIIPRSQFQRPAPQDREKHPTGPDGVKTMFCDICKINVYYVNPGGWRQHFKNKHGSGKPKILQRSVKSSGKRDGNQYSAPDIDESPDSPEVLIVNEESKEEAEVITLDDDASNEPCELDDSPVLMRPRLGQPSRFKCNKCKKWVCDIDLHKCYLTASKFDHKCNVLKKVVQFASQEGLDKHMELHHAETTEGVKLDVSLQDDGSYQFFAAKEINDSEGPKKRPIGRPKKVTTSKSKKGKNSSIKSKRNGLLVKSCFGMIIHVQFFKNSYSLHHKMVWRSTWWCIMIRTAKMLRWMFPSKMMEAILSLHRKRRKRKACKRERKHNRGAGVDLENGQVQMTMMIGLKWIGQGVHVGKEKWKT